MSISSSNAHSNDVLAPHMSGAPHESDYRQSFTPLLNINAVGFENTLGEGEAAFLHHTYPRPHDPPAVSRPKNHVAIPSTHATTQKKLPANLRKKKKNCALEENEGRHRSDLQSSVLLSRSKGSLMTASSVGSTTGDGSGASGSLSAIGTGTLTATKGSKKKGKSQKYDFEHDINNYVVRQTFNGVTRVLHKDGTVLEYHSNSLVRRKSSTAQLQGSRERKSKRGNSDSFQVKGTKEREPPTTESEGNGQVPLTANLLAGPNENNPALLSSTGYPTGTATWSSSSPRGVLSAPPAPALAPASGTYMLPALVQHSGPRGATHIGFAGEGADDGGNNTATLRSPDQGNTTAPQRYSIFTPPNNSVKTRNRRGKDSVANITFMDHVNGEDGLLTKASDHSHMSVDNAPPYTNFNFASTDDKGTFFMTGLDHAFHASSSGGGGGGGAGADGALLSRCTTQGDKKDEDPYITPEEEAAMSKLLTEHAKKREAARRVFRLDAESLFSIELPLFDDDGDVLAMPVPQKGSEKVAAAAAAPDVPNAEEKDREEQEGPQTFVYDYKNKDFLNSTFPNGVTPRQLHNYLLSKEKNKRVRTQFSEWNISRFMEQPVATRFIVTYFWFVVVRCRLTWVEKLLEGRYQRLVKAYDGLYITKDQKRGILPSLSTLDALCSELIAANYVWGKRQPQWSDKIESAEAGQLLMYGSATSENKLLPFLMDNDFYYLCQMREVRRLGVLPEADAIEILCDALDYFVTAMEEYEHLVHLEETFFGRLALAFGGHFLQLGAEKDFVFRQFSLITARTVYYTLNACFPNDAHARVFDANFRNDLVTILQHWYSGLVLTCVRTSGWPLPTVEDAEALAHMRELTANDKGEEKEKKEREEDEQEETDLNATALRDHPRQKLTPEGTTAANTRNGSFSTASGLASLPNRAGGGEGAVVLGADASRTTARSQHHKSRALQDDAFEEVDVRVENGGYRLISEFHKRANHANDLVVELEKRVKQQHKKQKRKLELVQRQVDRGGAQTFTNRNANHTYGSNNNNNNNNTNNNASLRAINVPFDDDGETTSLDLNSTHSESFYSLCSLREDHDTSEKRKASRASKVKHVSGQKSKRGESLMSTHSGASATASTFGGGGGGRRAAPRGGDKSSAEKLDTVERRRMQLTKKAGPVAGPHATAAGGGGTTADSKSSVHLLTLANRAEEAFRRSVNAAADSKETKDSVTKHAKAGGDKASPSTKQNAADRALDLPDNDGDESSILTRFPLSRCNGALRAYLLERAGLHYTDVPIAPSNLAAEAMIELQEHQRAHDRAGGGTLTRHTITNFNSGANACRFHSMKLKGMEAADERVGAPALNASMNTLAPPAGGAKRPGSVSSVFFRTSDASATDPNSSGYRPAFRLPAVSNQNAQAATAKRGGGALHQRAPSAVSCNTRMLPQGTNDIEGPPLNVRKHELSRGLLERIATARYQHHKEVERTEGGGNHVGGGVAAAEEGSGAGLGHTTNETLCALPTVSPFVAYYARSMLQLDLASQNGTDAAAAGTNKAPVADASMLDFSTQAGLGQSTASRMHHGPGASTRSLVIAADGNDTFNAALVAQKSHRAALRQLTVLPREAGQQRPQLLQGVHQEALRRQQNTNREMEIISQRDQVSRAMYTNQCIESSTEASEIESDKMRALFRRKAKRAFELKEKEEARQQQRQQPSEEYNTQVSLPQWNAKNNS